MKTTTKLWIGLAVLCLLSPLGLILPEYFQAGPAWGEGGTGEVRDTIGYIPAGMKRLEKFWSAPLPDYAFKGQEQAPLRRRSGYYIVSALLGVAAVIGAALIVGRIVTKRDQSKSS